MVCVSKLHTAQSEKKSETGEFRRSHSMCSYRQYIVLHITSMLAPILVQYSAWMNPLMASKKWMQTEMNMWRKTRRRKNQRQTQNGRKQWIERKITWTYTVAHTWLRQFNVGIYRICIRFCGLTRHWVWVEISVKVRVSTFLRENVMRGLVIFPTKSIFPSFISFRAHWNDPIACNGLAHCAQSTAECGQWNGKMDRRNAKIVHRNAFQYCRTFISFIAFMVDRIASWNLINWAVNQERLDDERGNFQWPIHIRFPLSQLPH